MPSESDNKIEELLKAYAKKRRQEAGTPFDLHPATRNLLQGEIARNYPKPGKEAFSFIQLLVRFWPRLAFAAVLVVAMVATIQFSNLKPNKPE